MPSFLSRHLSSASRKNVRFPPDGKDKAANRSATKPQAALSSPPSAGAKTNSRPPGSSQGAQKKDEDRRVRIDGGVRDSRPDSGGRRSPPRQPSPRQPSGPMSKNNLDGPYPTRSTSRFSGTQTGFPASLSASSLPPRRSGPGRPISNPRYPPRANQELYSTSLPTPNTRFPSRKMMMDGVDPLAASFHENPAVDRYPRPYVTPKNEFTNPTINGLNPSRANSRTQSMTSEFIYNYSLEGAEGFPGSAPSRAGEGRTGGLAPDMEQRRRISSYGASFDRDGYGNPREGEGRSRPPVPRIPNGYSSKYAQRPPPQSGQPGRLELLNSQNYSQHLPPPQQRKGIGSSSGPNRQPSPNSHQRPHPNQRRSPPPGSNNGEQRLEHQGDCFPNGSDRVDKSNNNVNNYNPNSERSAPASTERPNGVPALIPTPSSTPQPSTSGKEERHRPLRHNAPNSRSAPDVRPSSFMTHRPNDMNYGFHEPHNSPPSPISAPTTPTTQGSSQRDSSSSNTNITLMRQMIKKSPAPIMPGPAGDKCYLKDLTVVQEECAMGHDSNVLRKTGNLHHRVGCMLCGDLADQQTDDEEDGSECCANNKEGGWLWMCSWCALRICGECKFMLREEEKAISTPTSGEEPVPTGKKGVDLKALRSKVLEERALPKEQRKKRPSESALEKATGVEEHTQTPDVTQDSDGGHDITRRKALPLPEEEDVESHHSVVYITASTTPIPHEPRLNQEGSKEQGLEQAKLEHHLKATAPPMATRSRDSGVAIRGQSEESVYQGDEVDTGSTYVELDASDSLVMKSRTAPVKLNEIKPNKNSNESRSLEEEESLVKTETEAPVMRGPASFPPRGSSRAPVNATEENDREVVVLTASTPPKVDIPPRTEQPIVSVAVTPPPLPLKVEHPPRFDSRNATTVSAPVIETKPEVKQTERQNAATDSDRESTYDYDLSALLSSSMAALQNLHPRPAEKPVPIAKDVPSTPSRLTTINTTTVNPVLSTASPVSPIRKKPVPAASTPPSSPPVPPKVPANTSTSKSPATNTNMSPVGYSPSSLVKRKPVHPFLKSNSGDVTQKQHRGSGSFGSLGSLASFSIDRVKSNESHSSTGFSGLGFGRSEKKSNAVVVENKPAPFLLPPLEFEKMSTNMDIGVSAGLTTNGLFGDGGALGLEPPGSPRSNGFTPSINNGPQYYSPVGQLMGLGDYNGARAGNINGGNNQMDKSKRWLKGLFGKSLS